MRIGVHQPNYLPWCGYFAKLRASDVFVFLDDAEISPGQSYVYRTLVRNGESTRWLSIPTHRRMGSSINEVRIADPNWFRNHLNHLRQVYAKSPFFHEVFSWLEPIYAESGELLAEFNMRLIRAVVGYLGLTSRIECSSTLRPMGRRDDRLISLARIVGADTYVSGAGGPGYQDPAKFEAAGIGLEVRVYEPVPYPQRQGEFMPGLSIVDALFNRGRETLRLLDYPTPSAPEAL